MEENNKSYTAESITVLEGLEAVRLRPGMYIGTTGARGLHHLVWEVVDNSIDEALAGFCNKITVKVLPGNIIEVTDNGRGIPVDLHKTGRPTIEVVMTVLHAGGKFNDSNYRFSGGLHGVGVSVVNALSDELIATIRRDGKVYRQKFSKGNVVTDLEILDEVSTTTGTTITFKPDAEIFETTNFEYSVLENRLKELAYLNKGLTIELVDERKEEIKSNVFCFEGGIVDFINEVAEKEDRVIDDIIYMSDKFVLKEDDADNNVTEKYAEVAIAMTYKNSQNTIEYSFVNNINTYDGGTHVAGFRSALTKVINDVSKQMNIVKDKQGNFQGSDVREGLVAVISLKFPEPQFESQTKSKLGSSEALGIVSSIIQNKLKMYLEDNPKEASAIIDKILISKQAREAAKKARDLVTRKNNLEVGSLPGKLADCSSKIAQDCEIFIVEGNSAGGSAKQGRDRSIQAILPLRGKILNVEKSSLHKMLENEEIKSLITAFGTGIGERFDIEKLRYHKIVIMTDADVDGAHIRTLMLTFFYRYLKDLITEGYVYIAQPPLYKIQVGKAIKYAYSDNELKQITKALDKENKRYTIQRYKGLGEMNPEQLWETTMNPDRRTLLKVNLEDANYADKIFSVLMGDKVEPRREFIEEHANYVRNLDI